MDTFKDIVKQTEHVVKTLGTRWLKDAWKNEKEIGAVLELLSDAESRDAYNREIMWCFLRSFIKGELAATMAGMMIPAQWQASVTKTLQNDMHPEIEAPASALGTLNYSKTATFTLGQYRYGDRVMTRAGDVCLDLGACYGDTSLWMLDQGAAVHALKSTPGPGNFLQKPWRKNPSTAGYR